MLIFMVVVVLYTAAKVAVLSSFASSYCILRSAIIRIIYGQKVGFVVRGE